MLIGCQLFVDVSDRTTGSTSQSAGGNGGNSAGSGGRGAGGRAPSSGSGGDDGTSHAGKPEAASGAGGVTPEPAGGAAGVNGDDTRAGMGGSAPGEAGGASQAGASGAAGAETAGGGGTDVVGPRPPRSVWALWKMPNPATSSLPNPADYDTSEAGIVIDRVTALMWQRDAGPDADYAGAETYCETLSLGGYSDWRLPTRIELVSLFDFTRTAPAFDPVFGSHLGPYLTSSPYPGRDDAMYIVYFGAGYTSIGGKTTPGAVRCVR